MEQVYNKLVRDNIPEIIEKHGETPITRTLTEEEFRVELFKKLREECDEVCAAKKPIDLVQELADVLEVLKAIAALESRTLTNIEAVASQKAQNCGAYEKRIFLERKITGPQAKKSTDE